MKRWPARDFSLSGEIHLPSATAAHPRARPTKRRPDSIIQSRTRKITN